MRGSLPRKALWLAVLPLLVAGSEAAQAVLDRFTTASYRGAELLEPSHANALLGIAGIGALLLGSGFVGHVASGCRSRAISLWIFCLVPPVLFIVQEHVEYWVGHGGLAGSPAKQSAFLLGLALQAPFTLLAYIAARLLMRLAKAIADRLQPAPLVSEPSAPLALRDRNRSPRRVQLEGSRVTRGPPAPTVVSF